MDAQYCRSSVGARTDTLTVYSKRIDDADKGKERGKIDSMFGGMDTSTHQEKAATL